MLIELSREQREIVQQFRALAQANFRARAPRHDLECSFVTENFSDLARAGLLALPVPREHGGLGGGIGGDHLRTQGTTGKGGSESHLYLE